jgi:hypothetical protein
MCSNYTYKKDEAKLRLRDRILVYGAVPCAGADCDDLPGDFPGQTDGKTYDINCSAASFVPAFFCRHPE